MKIWLRRKLRKWLGITNIEAKVIDNRAFLGSRIVNLEHLCSDLVNIGVDVHFKSPHMILIYSKLNGGQLRHIDVNFRDLKELRDCVEELQYKYNTRDAIYDMPPAARQFFKY